MNLLARAYPKLYSEKFLSERKALNRKARPILRLVFDHNIPLEQQRAAYQMLERMQALDPWAELTPEGMSFEAPEKDRRKALLREWSEELRMAGHECTIVEVMPDAKFF